MRYKRGHLKCAPIQSHVPRKDRTEAPGNSGFQSISEQFKKKMFVRFTFDMSATTIPAKVLRAKSEAKDAAAAATKLEREHAVLAERCETLEARCAELTAASRDESARRQVAESARAEASEALSVAQAERKLVEATVGIN